MMKVNAALKRYFLIIIANEILISKLHEFLIHMAHACIQTMAGLYLISLFKLSKGTDITIYGDGSQSRSFCYVDDLIDVIVKFMDTEHGFTGPINIGNPDEFTIIELSEIVIELTGSKSKIIFNSLSENDPKQRQPDISLAQDKLGREPKTSLRKGLIKTIEYFDSILK